MLCCLCFLAVFLLLILLLLKYTADEESPNLSSIPGPRGWPMLGNILDLRRASFNPHVQFMKWANEYGPIYRVKLGANWTVVLNDYAAIYEGLVKRGKDISGREATSYRLQAVGFHPYGVSFTDMDQENVLTRKAIHKAFKAYGQGMGRIEELADQQSAELLNALDSSDGKPIDPFIYFNAAALKMGALLVFGEDIVVGSEDFKELIRLEAHCNRVAAPGFAGGLLDLMPWLRYLGNSLYKDITTARAIIGKFWNRFYTDKKQMWNTETSENKCLVETMFCFNKNVKHAPISEKYMCATAVQNIDGGTVTTTSTLYALFNILLHFPKVQSKMHSEIQAAIEICKVTYADRHKMPYVRAAILELHRFASLNPVGIAHKAVRETEILGYRIPKNTMIVTNFAALHHDESFWDHPECFRPERFLDDEGNLLPVDHVNVTHVKPFGAGVRMCVGENVATVRLFIWIVSILQRFEVCGEPLVPCHFSTYTGNITTRPQPYQVSFVPRPQ